ncbi:MAG: hypothetical protein Q9227_007565 [Pyrenula ochraceoflavens]
MRPHPHMSNRHLQQQPVYLRRMFTLLSPVAAEFVPGKSATPVTPRGIPSDAAMVVRGPLIPLPNRGDPHRFFQENKEAINSLLTTDRNEVSRTPMNTFMFGPIASVQQKTYTNTSGVKTGAIHQTPLIQNSLLKSPPYGPLPNANITTDYASNHFGISNDWNPPMMGSGNLRHGKKGIFTNESREVEQRNIMIKLPTSSMTAQILGSIFTLARYPSLESLDTFGLHETGLAFLSFFDIRDASIAFSNTGHVHPHCQALYLNPIERAIRNRSYGARETHAFGRTVFEGQFLATLKSLNSIIHNFEEVVELVNGFFGRFGDIKATQYWTWDSFIFHFRVEYFDIRDSQQAMHTPRGAFQVSCVSPTFHSKLRAIQKGFVLTLSEWSPRNISEDSSGLAPPVDLDNAQTPNAKTHPDIMRRFNIRTSGPRPVGTFNHNAVDTDRISAGLDVRTTVRLLFRC